MSLFRQFIASGVLVITALLSVADALAMNLDEIDQLFDKIERADISEPQAINEAIASLEAAIDKDDLPRVLRLSRLHCWNQDSTTEKLAAAAAVYANKLLGDPKNDTLTRADLLLCRGYYNRLAGKPKDALVDYDEAVKLAYQVESPRLIADARSLRGAILSFEGNFSPALEDLITAQHLYESLGMEVWSLNNLTELATSYRRFGDPQTAIRYYRQLEEKYRSQGEFNAATLVNSEIAMAYEAMNENAMALEYYRKTADYWESANEPLAAASIYVNMSGSLIKQGLVPEAKQKLAKAEQLIKIEHAGFYSFMKLYQAQIALQENQPDKALELLNQGEEAFNSIQNKRGLAELYTTKSQTLAALGDWHSAYGALETQNRLQNELQNQLQSQRTTEMRTRFDTDRMANENRQLLENQRLKEHELQILQQNKLLQLTTMVLVLVILAIVSVFAYKQAQRSKLMEHLALTDFLTKLPNRRHIYRRGELFVQQAKKQQSAMSVILFDADHFKKVNDHYGHDVGDKALVVLADCASAQMRKADMVGRIGGEEFLVLLPGTSLAQAGEIAERLRKAMDDTDMNDISTGLSLTISAGVASLDKDKSFSALLNRADHALYQAKAAGRNQVVLDGPHSLAADPAAEI
ncbi:diguanylate cyclase [Shewanella cyperi]|uniref:diguanylate cyclase n=1 Tax=Shewanella cyperi TaxID=2814292 RepID=A0A975AKD0_9GAMM|nr:GGDEF domain-containing protein [Shewanella cyperi]QSX29222.1 diguanylate cyclase [Shewanella cyperi]